MMRKDAIAAKAALCTTGIRKEPIHMGAHRLVSLILLTIGCAICFSSCVMVDKIRLLSDPPGAKVYLVPLYRFEADTSLVSDDAKLAEFIVPEGLTPVMTRALEKRYVVVFDLNGEKLTTRIDILRGQTNQAKVVFP